MKLHLVEIDHPKQNVVTSIIVLYKERHLRLCTRVKRPMSHTRVITSDPIRRTTPSTMYHRHSLLSCTVSKTSDNSNLHNLYAWLCVLRISHHANTPWLLLLILADTKGKTIRYWPDRSLKPIMVQNQGGNNPEGVNHITSSYPVKDDFNLFFPKRWLSISKYGYPILFKPTVEFANLAYDPG